MAQKTKMQTEEKNKETKRRQSERRICLRKCFHLLKYVIDHENFYFFFVTSLRTCYKSLNDNQTQHDSFCTTCCIFSGHIASQHRQVSSHTNFVYEYMNSLKTIHEEECFVNWKMFYKEIKEQTGPGSAFLEHFQAQILKMYPLCASHFGVFVSLIYVPDTSEYVTAHKQRYNTNTHCTYL